MKSSKKIVVMTIAYLTAFVLYGGEKRDIAVPLPGLVAHYFEDPKNWDGAWPDNESVPRGNPQDWTFSAYRYSRVEPVINHVFIRRGWFSIRWTGWLDTGAPAPRLCASSMGKVNLNPAASELNEFCLVLPDGTVFTRENIVPGGKEYNGPARLLRFRTKGNANENSMTLDGAAYPLRNGVTYELSAARMDVKLCQDGSGAGNWFLEINAANATFASRRDASDAAADLASRNVVGRTGRAGAQYVFYALADDGCRLIVDGRVLIDDWRACSEQSPDALRRSSSVTLEDGMHSIAVEYFQGQSLLENDKDPIVLFWACSERGIERQVIPPAVFWHTSDNTSSVDRAR